MEYHEFVTAKLGTAGAKGIAAPVLDYGMFPHQRDLTAWALLCFEWADAMVEHAQSRKVDADKTANAEITGRQKRSF